MRRFDVTISGMISIFIFALMFETSRRRSVILIFPSEGPSVFSKPFIIINMASVFSREPLLKRRANLYLFVYIVRLFKCLYKHKMIKKKMFNSAHTMTTTTWVVPCIREWTLSRF